ncbi:MAG TPA: hypothetical protein VLF95_13275, partial [Vicinamibacteria bacterium]|nr:hypothetical protein [Vicinamibacteria bacterium]
MVYQAGDNNLAEDMVLALQDLAAEGGSLQGSRIVAQLDPSGFGLSAQRYDFGRKAPGKPLDEYRDPDSSPSEVNTGSQEALEDFIRWADRVSRVDKETKK